MDKKSNSDYTVGYKKPPRETQFRPGQSGNPSGRPQKTPTLTDAVLRALDSQAIITVDGKTMKLAVRDVIAKRHTTQAAKGDHKSTKIVMNLAKGYEDGEGDNLRALIDQFRAANERHRAADRKHRSTANRRKKPAEK